MSKHTPGPWKLEHDELHYGSLSTVVAGKKSNKFPGYQMLVDVGGFAGVDEQESNARLIASAPELLEVLKVMIVVFQPRTGEPSPDAHVETVVWDNARQAIAKAEAL
jgi:hypothetical protein